MAKTDSDLCKGCNAQCCRYVAVELDEPDTEEEWDEIIWMLHHKNLTVYKDNDGDWLVEFNTDCKNLDKDGKCTGYTTRPKLCKEHSVESCVRHGEGDVAVIMFETPEDVEEYRKLLKKGPVKKFLPNRKKKE